MGNSGFVTGVDVSRYQGSIDWKQVAASGVRFAVIRASIGSIYKDPRFIENWNGAKEAGLLVSAYHVVRWDVGPLEQVQNFLAMIDSVNGEGQNDLPWVLDVELPTPAGRSESHIRAIEYTAAIAARFVGSEPFEFGLAQTMVYTGAWWWKPAWEAYSATGQTFKFPKWLWTADYTENPDYTPQAYAPWVNWSVRQYSSTGKVPGIVGNCDMNRVKHDSAFYKNYLEQPEPPLPPDPPLPPLPDEQIVVINTDKQVKIIINGSVES